MSKKIVVGNWKMHGFKEDVNTIVTSLVGQTAIETQCDMVICPPFVYLQQAQQRLQDSAIYCGAQDLSGCDNGAYTGDVSARMLRDCGISHVIVGHSERRSQFKEDTKLLQKKIKQALEHNIIPIFCIGEDIDTRQNNNSSSFLAQQIVEVFSPLHKENLDLSTVIIAYEPVWAIGSNTIASEEIICQTHADIKRCLRSYNMDNNSVIYGGSVKEDNVAIILSIHNVDGVLVGGASLKSDQFLAIYNLSKQIVQ